jgi:hypothetical protein
MKTTVTTETPSREDALLSSRLWTNSLLDRRDAIAERALRLVTGIEVNDLDVAHRRVDPRRRVPAERPIVAEAHLCRRRALRLTGKRRGITETVVIHLRHHSAPQFTLKTVSHEPQRYLSPVPHSKGNSQCVRHPQRRTS